jgi:hypothetical protein
VPNEIELATIKDKLLRSGKFYTLNSSKRRFMRPEDAKSYYYSDEVTLAIQQAFESEADKVPSMGAITCLT